MTHLCLWSANGNRLPFLFLCRLGSAEQKCGLTMQVICVRLVRHGEGKLHIRFREFCSKAPQPAQSSICLLYELQVPRTHKGLGGGEKRGGGTAQTRIQKWCTYWFAGALCTPASNCAGSTLYDIVLVFPSCNCALPAVPCCVEIVKGVSICQHSSVEALLAAPSAVIFSCRAAADGSSTASSTTVERSRVNVCILACETLQ